MALKIELKPKERILLGDCVVTNTGPRTRLQIEGHVRILREKDIMTLPQADSLAKLIYLAIQFIYTANNPKEHHELYFRLSERARLTANWSVQAWGRTAGSDGNLDLVNFERHQARLVFGVNF